MLIIPEIVRFARRPKAVAATLLALIAASFDDDALVLTMTFDRAVSIEDYDGASTLVNVPAANVRYAGDDGATLSPDGRTVSVACEPIESAQGTTAWVTVPADSGLADATTGEAWAGATAFALTE